MYKGTLGVTAGNLPAEKFTIDIPYGIYEMTYTDRRNEISKRQTIMVGDVFDRLYFAPRSTSSDDLCLISSPDGDYCGSIQIPESISIDGTEHTVTAIGDNVFYHNSDITSIDMPKDIEKNGFNATSYCRNLEHIFIRSEQVPFSFRNHFATGMNSNTVIYVPATAYNEYQNILNNRNPLYSTIDRIESKNHVASKSQETVSIGVHPAHPHINPEFTVTPLANGLDPAAEASISGIDKDGNLSISVNARHSGTASFEIRSSQPGVAPATFTVTIPQSAAIGDIGTDRNKTPSTYYDLNGYPVSGQNLQNGHIYIDTKPGQRGKTILKTE